MKRILAAAVSLAMLMSLMTVGASAAGYPGDSGSNVSYETGGHTANGSGNGYRADGSYADGATIATGTVTVKGSVNTIGHSVVHVYAVGISQTELTYTYGSGSNTVYTWDPSQQKYVVSTEGGSGSNGWQEEGQSITVTNYSDLGVVATARYSQTNTSVTGTITDTDSSDSGSESDGIINLATAILNPGTSYENTGTPTTGTFTLTLEGNPGAISTGSALGTLTITFTKPSGG